MIYICGSENHLVATCDECGDVFRGRILTDEIRARMALTNDYCWETHTTPNGRDLVYCSRKCHEVILCHEAYDEKQRLSKEAAKIRYSEPPYPDGCFANGITGNCGAKCDVLQRGECEDQGEMQSELSEAANKQKQ